MYIFQSPNFKDELGFRDFIGSSPRQTYHWSGVAE